MEELERRVWERVAAGERPGGPEPPDALLRVAREIAEESRALSRDSRSLREETEITRILMGIRVLGQSGGSQRVQRLRRLYHRCRRAMTDYAARAAVPEVGLAYQYLSELERQHCLEILRMLGSGK